MTNWLVVVLAVGAGLPGVAGGGAPAPDLAQVEPLTPPPPPPSIVPPPPPPPPLTPPPTPPPTPVAPAAQAPGFVPAPVGPERGPTIAEEQQRQRRPRRFFDVSRGADSAIFIGEIIAGGIAGGIIGARLGSNTAQSIGYAFLGVPLGGVVFALAAATFLRFAPENVAWLALLAGVVLGTAAAGVALRARWDAGTAMVGVILGMQLGLLALFVATIAIENVSDDDTALIRMATGNATYAAAAVMWLLSSVRSQVDWTWLLFVPALAMAGASALALAVDVPARVMDFMIGIPILASAFITTMVTFLLTDGFRQSLDSAGPAPAIVALSTWGAFMLVGLFVDTKRDRDEKGARVTFAPFVAPALARSGGLTVGAAALGRF